MRFVCQCDKRPRSGPKTLGCNSRSDELREKVAAKLNKMSVANYVPVQQEEHQWSDRKKKIDRVVIPMVVFVRLRKNEEEVQ